MDKFFLDKEKLLSQKFARVDGQKGKCGKDIIDFQCPETMARYYGQNIEISLNQFHVNLHPFYTKYISVMFDATLCKQKMLDKTKRRGNQRDTSIRCSITQRDFH